MAALLSKLTVSANTGDAAAIERTSAMERPRTMASSQLM
jgi:hypothetical protein